MSEDLRLFFAVPTPEEIKQQAQQIQEQCDCPGLKISWVGPDRMHFTLKFLGDTPQAQVSQLAEVARRVAQLHPPHQVTVAGAGAFPNIHRPRIIWVGCSTGTQQLAALGTELDQALTEAKLAEPEQRDFVPHLTLGRVRQGRNFDELTASLEELGDRILGQMPVDHFVLMHSDLQPGRAPVYTELNRFKLGNSEEDEAINQQENQSSEGAR